VDAGLAALVALATSREALRGTGPEQWAWFLVAHVPLVWRRSRPVAVCWTVLLLTVPGIASGVQVESFYPELVVLVAIYAAARYGSLPQLVPITVVTVLAPVGISVALDGWTLGAFGFVTSLTLVSTLLGITVRTRQAYLGQLAERALQREREHEQELRLAAATERARIARDVHDVVAHNIAVMIALADGAALTAAKAPGRAADAMAKVSATGRQALGDMRRVLGVLQDTEQVGTAPQPDLADVDDLVAQVRSAGLAVTLTVEGEPGAWGPGAGLAVYRIVQESLTNTLKHAGTDATAHVVLRHGPDGTEVEVTDDGAGRPIAAAVDGGRGLAGMVERAAAYGGKVTAGPREDGAGWRVRATVRPGEGPA
jgi:signal transduction histidine kinase